MTRPRATTHLLTLAVAAFLLARCAEYSAPIVSAPTVTEEVKSVFLQITADQVTKLEVEARIVGELRTRMPNLRVVDHPAISDVDVSLLFDDDDHCVDCGAPSHRDWWWQANLNFRNGGSVVLTGHVPKLRGRFEPFFVHQLTRYLCGSIGCTRPAG